MHLKFSFKKPSKINFKCMLNPINHPATALNPDHIKPTRMLLPARLFAQKDRSRPGQFGLLEMVDTGRTIGKYGCAAHAHFDKHQVFVVVHDQVDFTVSAVPVALKQFQALRFQVTFGLLFRALAGQAFQHGRSGRL